MTTDTQTIEQVEAEIKRLEEEMRPLERRKWVLHESLRCLKSIAFIRANNITLDDVEMSSGEDKPWFGICTEFGKWLKETGCQKRFCEWNHHIYFTAEVIQGRWDHSLPGCVDELDN